MKATKIMIVLILGAILVAAGNKGYQLGDQVKDFKLKNVTGEMVALSDYKDQQGVILIFDCNTCPYSQAYLERIKNLNAKYASKGFPVVAINSNDAVQSPGDTYSKMVSYAKSHGYTHAYLHDADQSVARAFGATNTPHVYVLKNNAGVMTVSYIGAIDNNTRDASAADKKYVENAVDAMLKGAMPEVTKTKAIGCTIKWGV